ncbi:hypothetical protein, partial [Mesorhizobium sp.]|uniref:hypothetical protein n=1 Tax=Mesorhizobium sp. TaxID=1871066 RepID=UPI0025F85EF6
AGIAFELFVGEGGIGHGWTLSLAQSLVSKRKAKPCGPHDEAKVSHDARQSLVAQRRNSFFTG